METVVNAILVRHGEVLLGKRSPTRSNYPGSWSLPGGHVEGGETLDQALIRETREELGITPLSYRAHSTLVEMSPFSGNLVTYHLFAVERWKGNPVLCDTEHTEMRWFPISDACEIADLAIRNYRTALRLLARNDDATTEQHEEVRTARVMNILKTDCQFQLMLDAVRKTSLPEAAIGAGAIRNRIWNALHGFDPAEYSDEDIDVLFFDERDQSEASEQIVERRLREMMPSVIWSVKNQARMHLTNSDAPSENLEHAVTHWLETPTAVAVTAEEIPRLIAPYGLRDLLDLCVRPTPSGNRKPKHYRKRVEKKRWLLKWPQLLVEWPSQTRAETAFDPIIRG